MKRWWKRPIHIAPIKRFFKTSSFSSNVSVMVGRGALSFWWNIFIKTSHCSEGKGLSLWLAQSSFWWIRLSESEKNIYADGFRTHLVLCFLIDYREDTQRPRPPGRLFFSGGTGPISTASHPTDDFISSISVADETTHHLLQRLLALCVWMTRTDIGARVAFMLRSEHPLVLHRALAGPMTVTDYILHKTANFRVVSRYYTLWIISHFMSDRIYVDIWHCLPNREEPVDCMWPSLWWNPSSLWFLSDDGSSSKWRQSFSSNTMITTFIIVMKRCHLRSSFWGSRWRRWNGVSSWWRNPSFWQSVPNQFDEIKNSCWTDWSSHQRKFFCPKMKTPFIKRLFLTEFVSSNELIKHFNQFSALCTFCFWPPVFRP